MVLIFHRHLSQVTCHDPLPLIRGQNSKFLILHNVSQNIWGLVAQILHWFFLLTSQRQLVMTSDLLSKVKIKNHPFTIMNIEIKLFWVKELKNDIVFFNTTSQRPTNNLKPLLKNIIRPIFCPVINLGANLFTLIPMYFNIHYGKRQGWIPILTSDQRIFDDL